MILNWLKMDNLSPKRKFIGLHFDCCNKYSRIYVNRMGTAYEGMCPGCYRPVRIRIGEGGVDTRFFRGS
jgi:hypothetical protein